MTRDTRGGGAGTRTGEVASSAPAGHAGPADTLAVIVAAGDGSRFGNPGGKHLVDVCGRPMLAWSVEAFRAAPSVAGIVVVCPRGGVEAVREGAVGSARASRGLAVVEGGTTRQESVACGLAAGMRLAERTGATFDLVAVHDGARPLVSVATIERVVAEVRGEPGLTGAIAAAPLTDTLKRVGADEVITDTPDRTSLWSAMTPQVFRTSALLSAYEQARGDGFLGTDDASLVERAGGRVRCVATPRDNLKVTYPEDLAIVEALMGARGGAAALAATT